MKNYFALIFSVLHFSLPNCNAIIGGTNATYGEFPYMVSLRNETNLHYCGGVLITKKHVLTAAHCLYTDRSMFFGILNETLPVESVKVMVDTVSIEWDPDKSYEVEKMVHHPEYAITNLNSLNYDIAIVTLKNKVTQPAVVVATIYKDPIRVGNEATVLGWGISSISYIFTLSTNTRWLQKLSVSIVDPEICESQIRKKRESFGDMVKASLASLSVFCAYKGKKTGVCIRDSGSPILIDGKLAGHVFFGVPCAQNVPDLYTSIIKYANFVNTEVGQMLV